MKKSLLTKIVSFCIGFTIGCLNAQSQLGDRCFMPENAVDLRGYSGFHEQSKIWASQVIPYYFSDNLSEYHKDGFFQSIAALESATNLCFIPKRSEPLSMGVFNFSDNYSYADIKENNIYLSSSSPYVIIHEICHLMGMSHEHQRPGRGDYVKILWENIDPKFIGAFTIYNNLNAIETPAYDYYSIMHYGANFFSTNGLPTIERIDGGGVGGNILSNLDIALLDSLYPKQIDCQKARDERAPYTSFKLRNKGQICTFESIKLENQTEYADTYHWETDFGSSLVGNEREFSVYFTTAGWHTITQRSANNFDTSEFKLMVHVKDCSGLEIDQLLPNPTQGNLQCKLSKVLAQEFLVSIVAANGQYVYTKMHQRDFDGQDVLSFDVPPTLADGTYFIQIEMYGFRAIKPFVLQR
jgi:hypothetical protein